MGCFAERTAILHQSLSDKESLESQLNVLNLSARAEVKK